VSDHVYARRSARVLLVDAAERVLLFRARSDLRLPATEDNICWFTPGGGVESGETLAVAAARELQEETGLATSPQALGDPVAWAEGEVHLGGESGRFRDDFFSLRVDSHDVDMSGFQPGEATVILDHRWWTVPELRAARHPVYPFGLADLLTDLATDGRPPSPVRLPWHHDEN
jgi:8-oxo-dGTP pyrophosphatase MutT (NUDIX family)